MQDTDFDPVRAQRLILNLRVENRQLKARLREIDRLSEKDLPAKWQKELTSTRKESARLRIERNRLREELAAARAEPEAQRRG